MQRTSPLSEILDQSLQEIASKGELRAPAEACGLLLDVPWMDSRGVVSYVRELPNRSLQHGAYKIEAGDIHLVLETYPDDVEISHVAIWHTHPSGFVGPSDGDLAFRSGMDLDFVVVAMTPDGPVATWF